MVSNYVKTSVRKFKRAKVHTFINLFGLALGLLCAVILFQKLRFEMSFEDFRPDADRVFRVVHESTFFGETSHDEGVPYPFVDAFREDFPEAEHVTIIDRNFGAVVLAVEGPGGEWKKFRSEEGAAFVEPDYFEIFDYEWLRGDPATALSQPKTVVLSRKLAEQFFGDEDPVGRIVRFDNDFDLTVTGVVEDLPPNTSVPLTMLISFDLGEADRRGSDNWNSTSSSVQCFVKLPEGVAASRLERRFRDFVVRYRNEETAQGLRYFLQPLPEIHYDDRFNALGGPPVMPRAAVWTLGLIGVFLLLTACINFVNLNIVLVFRRAKEVGVRKVLGSSPGQVVAHFLTETALVTLGALVLAFLAAGPVLSLGRPFLGEGFTVNPLADPVLVAFGLATALVLTLLSGLYPAVLLSRLSPTTAMHGRPEHRPGSFMTLRRGLVVLQFAISQLLIICTLVAMHQMDYLRSAPLGYETSALIEFDIPDREPTRLETLKQRLLQETVIRGVTVSNSGASSGNTWGSNFHYHKDGERIEHRTQIKLVDRDYIDTYRMELVAGQNFTPGDSIDQFIVNESFARRMGFEQPAEALGTIVEIWGDEAPVTGVVRDFNTNSLHRPIEETILIPTTQYAYVGAARVDAARLPESIEALETAWTEAFPEYVFDYTFLDDRIAEFYEDERAMRLLVQVFALIAILIGCIGLFGLISYTTAQRAKEVGIRKVLGASVTSIVALFTREFVAFVVVAFAVAAPAGYYVMKAWLQDFAYRIELGPGLFVVAFAASLLVALATVGFRTYRSAVANPVDAIRDE